MIRSVILDFDGVILESADIKTCAFETLFAAWPQHLANIVDYHLEHSGISRFVKIKHIREVILGLPPDVAEEERLAEQFAALVEAEVMAAPFVPGAREFLDRSGGRMLFVASGTPQEELLRIISARGIAHTFAGVFGSPETKAAIIRRILSTHGFLPGEVAFVGDGASDEAASREVGVPFVARIHAAGALADGLWHVRDLTELARTLAQIDQLVREATG